MDELLANPAVQAAAAPFLAALVVAALLVRTRFGALAICAGAAVAAALSMGFSLESLTAARKLVLCVLACGVLVLVAGLAPAADRRPWALGTAIAAGLAAVWVLWRVLVQQEGARPWWTGAAAALFMALLVFESLRAEADALRTGAASLGLGLGSGALGVLGASVVLGQFGIAIGASAGALLLVQMLFGRRSPGSWATGLPAAVAAGLVCVVSVVTGQLPWYAPLPLLAVPWFARMLPAGERPVWLDAVLSSACALVPVIVAVTLAWFNATPAT